MKETVRIDLYTKAVLTIIAVCLVWICLGSVLRSAPPLQAASQGLVDVRIRGIEKEASAAWDPVAIMADETLPVEVQNQNAVPVQILNELVPVDVKNVVVKTSLVPVEIKEN